MVFRSPFSGKFYVQGKYCIHFNNPNHNKKSVADFLLFKSLLKGSERTELYFSDHFSPQRFIFIYTRVCMCVCMKSYQRWPQTTKLEENFPFWNNLASCPNHNFRISFYQFSQTFERTLYKVGDLIIHWILHSIDLRSHKIKSNLFYG